MKAPQTNDCKRIRARLKELATSQPQLKALISTVPANCSITKRFLTAYFEADIHYSRKSLVLRTLLEEPLMIPGSEEKPVTLSLYQRVAQYFQNHPKQPLVRLTVDFKKDDIPAHLERLWGIPRTSARGFFTQFGLIPYLHYRRGTLPENYHRIQFPAGTDLDFLRPFYTSRLLTPVTCRELLEGRATPSEHNTYFHTGDEALSLRNMLSYLRSFWEQDRKGGQLQSKIPRRLSDFFHITRLSIPELGFVTDILGLAVSGAVDFERLPTEADWIGAHQLMGLVATGYIEDLEELARDCFPTWLMTAEKADRLYGYRQAGEYGGTFESGFYFNLDRLLTRSQGSRFAGYYQALDDRALTDLVHKHYRRVAPDFAAQLTAIQQRFPGEFQGIRIRDLANILFHVWYHREQDRETRTVLPTVAKYALGMAEYTPSGKPQTRKQKGRGKQRNYDVRLPLLDSFLSAGGKCYLLHPGYDGLLPTDGPVVLPKAIARGYAGLPESVVQIGPERLPWGANPYDSEYLEELAVFNSVTHLKK